MEGATAWRICRTRQIACKQDPLPLLAGFCHWYSGQQGPRIRMARIFKQGSFIGNFYDTAQIHDGDPVAQMLDD